MSDESVTELFGKVGQEQIGAIKLSAAIRIGAAMKPQCFGSSHAGGGSCAIGAALDGGYEGSVTDSLVSKIVRMNDDLRLSRESIADWLEAQGY